MCTGMGEIFALKENFSTTGIVTEALRKIERREASGKLPEVILELFLKFRIAASTLVFSSELLDRDHERFRYVNSAIGTEMAMGIGNVAGSFSVLDTPGHLAGRKPSRRG